MTDRHAIESDEVMAYLDGELPSARAELVRDHLEQCAACRELADELRQVSTRLQEWDVDPAPATLPATVADALNRRSSSVGSRWSWLVVPGVFGLPRWGLAAGSLAAVALVAIVARPGSGPEFESVGDLAENVPVAAPGSDAGVGEAEARRELQDAAKMVGGIVLAERPAQQVQSPDPAGTAVAAIPPARVDAPPAEIRAARAGPPSASVPPPAAPPARQESSQVGQARAGVVAGQRSAATNLARGGVADAAPAGLTYGAVAPLPEPVIVERTRLTLSTADLDQARASLAELANRLGGRIDLEAMTGDGDARVLTATVQVPIDQLDTALGALRELGTVQEDARDADDIAERALDVSARQPIDDRGTQETKPAERPEFGAIALTIRIVRR